MDNVVPFRGQSVEADTTDAIGDDTITITITLPCSDLSRLQSALMSLEATAALSMAILAKSHLYAHAETIRGVKQVFKALAHLLGHG